jgi:hypothetical protein
MICLSTICLRDAKLYTWNACCRSLVAMSLLGHIQDHGMHESGPSKMTCCDLRSCSASSACELSLTAIPPKQSRSRFPDIVTAVPTQLDRRFSTWRKPGTTLGQLRGNSYATLYAILRKSLQIRASH